MSKALVIIKSMGIGDLVILIANIHAISQAIKSPVTVLAQENTKASAILKHDPCIAEVIDLDKKGIINIVKKIKSKNFDQSYIYSDSLRLYIISKLSGINKNFHYNFFSKRGKNFFKAANEFTEKTLKMSVDHNSKIFWDMADIEKTKKKFNISNETKNIVCGISASGPTKRWDIKNYIKLFEKINKNYPSRFFIAAGPKDEDLVSEVMSSSIKDRCISFSKMKIEETIPIISACQFYIGNDTGWGQISAALNLKSLFLFCDSPTSYGLWRKNISIIVPKGETIESCSHNTRGKDKISFQEVLDKTFKLIN